ncbi:AraC-like DNA-binding protein [Keratinibaculum paraultunense]|uniref:AraC-like DNA-binding protein n=1 Tax=Keratinibaculum paraultunense TaxID=1278232 RepID=A0A4R3L4D2_9FIRM|nr:helix-turn-helix domain-containing protein [Keratinibaculum paraultunense]QQY80120.1 helix-turn-helix domain-containing protein [Keratinibaculum paraultunense]TCS91559.1 AraC-like DNA-binding protein [Keratinibaculum paraultunense]
MATESLEVKGIKDLIKFRKIHDIVMTEKSLPYRIFLAQIEGKQFLAYEALELVYVIKGTVKIQTREGIKKLTKGDFYIIDSSKAYSILSGNEDTIIIFLQIEPDYLEEKFGISKNTTFLGNLDNMEINENIIYSLGLLYIESLDVESGYYCCINRLTDLINDIEPYMVESTCGEYENKKETIESIIFDIVEKYAHNVNENITLERMAQEYNVSYSYLSRMFKEITGMNFTRFFLNQKLYKAIDLLLNTEKTITEIAICSGFSDIKSLNREFNRTFGMPPTSFRRQYEYINKNIENYIQNILYWDESVQEFIEIIKKEKRNRYVKKDVEIKNYIVDMYSNIGINQRTWGNVIDLNCITGNDIEKLDNILRKFKPKSVVIKFKFVNDNFLLVTCDGELRKLSKLEFNQLIKILNDNYVNPIIQIDFMSQNMGKFLNDEYAFHQECYFSMMKMLDIISAIVGVSLLSKWKFELYIPNINRLILNDNFSKLIFSHIDNFINILEDKFGQASYNWGLYIGEINICHEHEEELEFLKKLRKISNQPQFYDIELVYDDYIIEKKGLHYLGEKLNCVVKEINSYLQYDKNINEQNILASFNHIVSDSKFLEEHRNFYYILFLNLVLPTMKQKDLYIYSYNLIDEEEKTKRTQSIFCEEFGIKLPFYYILEFIGELGEDILWMGDGCFATKNGSDIVILLYSNFNEYNKYVDNIFTSTKNGKIGIEKKMVLDIRGLKGKYKITEYRLDHKNSMFYKEFLDKTGLNSLTEEERIYIQSKAIPEMKVSSSNGKDRLIYQTKLKFLDVGLIRLQQICTKCKK